MTQKIIKNTKEIKTKRCQGFAFFLTLAQVKPEITKQNCLELLLEHEKINLQHYIISEEIHTSDVNKGRHLHIYLRFRKRLILGFKHFDYLGCHGNLQNVRVHDNVINYIIKEDRSPLVNIDIHTVTFKGHLRETLIRLHNEGYQYHTIFALYKAHLPIDKLTSIKNYLFELSKSDERERILNLPGMRYIDRPLIEKRLTPSELVLFDEFDGYKRLVDILNKISKLGYKQNHKDCCCSIVGFSNIGKTYVFNKLQDYLPIYRYPEDGWHLEYQNNLYSGILWHEWSYTLQPPQDYLRTFEGLATDLKIKGAKGQKMDRPYIILTSNFSYVTHIAKRHRNLDEREVYTKSLSNRINEIDFGDKTLMFIPKLFVKITEDI